MAHDFSKGPDMKVKTSIKFNPFKLKESETPATRGKRIWVDKKKEDVNSSIKLKFQWWYIFLNKWLLLNKY